MVHHVTAGGGSVSWDAALSPAGHPDIVIDTWNYTHNTNAMANLAIDPGYDTTIPVGCEVLGIGAQANTTSWWRQLDGMTGHEGAELLTRIIDALTSDPDRYEALNPANGWGDRTGFVAVLTEMRAAVPEAPTRWRVS